MAWPRAVLSETAGCHGCKKASTSPRHSQLLYADKIIFLLHDPVCQEMQADRTKININGMRAFSSLSLQSSQEVEFFFVFFFF